MLNTQDDEKTDKKKKKKKLHEEEEIKELKKGADGRARSEQAGRKPCGDEAGDGGRAVTRAAWAVRWQPVASSQAG